MDEGREMIKRALDLASKNNHSHVAGILDSLGELKILRGELDEAEQLLEKAVDLQRKKERLVHGPVDAKSRALLPCPGNVTMPPLMPEETIDLSSEIGDKHYANMAGLVLAESYLHLGRRPNAWIIRL